MKADYYEVKDDEGRWQRVPRCECGNYHFCTRHADRRHRPHHFTVENCDGEKKFVCG